MGKGREWMGTDGHGWAEMGADGRKGAWMGPCGCRWVSVDVDGRRWAQMEMDGGGWGGCCGLGVVGVAAGHLSRQYDGGLWGVMAYVCGGGMCLRGRRRRRRERIGSH
jgi:hypothetical protein